MKLRIKKLEKKKAKSMSEVVAARPLNDSKRRAAPAHSIETEKPREPWWLPLRIKRNAAAEKKKAERGKGEREGKGNAKTN